MALPEYQRHVVPGGPGPTPSVNTRMAGAEGEALAGVGGAIGQVGRQLDAKANEDAQVWTANAMSAAHVSWMDRLQKAQDAAPAGAPNFAGQMLGEFDQFKTDQLAQAPDATSKRFLGERLAALRTSVYGQAVSFEAQQGLKYRNDQTDQSILNVAQTGANNPEQGKTAWAELDATLQASQHQEWALEKRAKLKADVSEATVRGMVLRDPRGAADLLNTYFGIQPARPIQPGQPERPAPDQLPNLSNATLLQTAAAVSPTEQATSDAFERSAGNLSELRAAVQNERNPQNKAILQAELDKQSNAATAYPVKPQSPDQSIGLSQQPPPVKDKSGNVFVDSLAPHQAWSLRNEAITELHRLGAVDKTAMDMRVKDYQSMVLSGVAPPQGSEPSPAEYAAVHGVAGSLKWQQDVGNYADVAGGLRQMGTASMADRYAIIAAADPTTTAGPDGSNFEGRRQMQQALMQANQLVEKKINADPAGYAAATAPRVAAAHDAMMASMQDQNATPETRSAAANTFATAMTAEQTRLGVGLIREDSAGADTVKKQPGPKLLTNSEANSIAAQFMDQKTGGANAAQLVDGLAKTWGRWWPQVYGQLATDNKLPPAALVIPNMSDDAAKAHMAAVSVVKSETLKEQMAPTDPKDIRDTLLSQFDQARGTFSAQGVDGMRTMSLIMDQAEKSALAYRVAGKSPADAAKQAYQETMGWKYDFESTYRIPNDQAPKDVRAGAQATMAALDTKGLQIMAAPGVPMTPEKRAELSADAIKANGLWITNGDETGLRLMVQGRDGAMAQVRDQNGAPFERTWSALRDAAVTAATERMTRLQEAANDPAARMRILQESAEQDRVRRLREMGLR